MSLLSDLFSRKSSRGFLAGPGSAMIARVLVAICLVNMVLCEKDWVWNEKGENERAQPRYQIYENSEHPQKFGSQYGAHGFRPQQGSSFFGVPPYRGDREILVGPGAPFRTTGLNVPGRPQRPIHPTYPNGGRYPGVSPPWIGDDRRYREYDVCRCRYSFNCPPTGVKFGSCSRNKKYCCFDSRKYPSLVQGRPDSRYPPYLTPGKYGPAEFPFIRRPSEGIRDYDDEDYEDDDRGFSVYSRSLNATETESRGD